MIYFFCDFFNFLSSWRLCTGRAAPFLIFSIIGYAGHWWSIFAASEVIGIPLHIRRHYSCTSVLLMWCWIVQCIMVESWSSSIFLRNKIRIDVALFFPGDMKSLPTFVFLQSLLVVKPLPMSLIHFLPKYLWINSIATYLFLFALIFIQVWISGLVKIILPDLF